MFKDRTDAGKALASALQSYQDQRPLVLAIPRGGVPVGYEVALALNGDFSLLMACKYPHPANADADFGAIAEDGSAVFLSAIRDNLPVETVTAIMEAQEQEIKRRIQILRGGEALPPLVDRTVILVDEGVGTGSTLRAAVKMVSRQKPRELVVAAPVSSPEAAHSLQNFKTVTETVFLKQPRFFRAIKEAYHHFEGVTDYDVLEIMKRWHSRSA